MTAVAEGTAYVDHSIPGHKPGSPEWVKYLTASKIAAVMGHSTYDSYFSMWHRMAGNIDPEPAGDEALRGHYLEPSIANWFADQMPDYEVLTTGMWVAKDNPRFAATPDRFMVPKNPGMPLALAEVKSSNNDWEWGAEDTEEIPLGYYDQVTWQMRCIRTYYPEIEGVHVPVLTIGLNFAKYYVPWDADYAEVLERKATAFMDALDAGEAPSIDPLDGHLQTYNAIKKLHPDIEPGSVELTDAEARPFLEAHLKAKAADLELQAAKNVVAMRMGNLQTAKFRGKKMFTRISKQGGTPYMTTARGLPAADILTEMENTAA
ncbi:RecE-like recombination exonuclease [Arthrobacter phage DrYang]|uniref:RecE-like exonuclease n=1 Tax=Arthrobacter phage DrYang TaxID=2686080 RepID=A0A6B9JD37_9CAUD|nr:RecE-like recombination exonuclease [Arthrobacter phage DrYang]QGZ17146.1 RecE-like exonuclease [Arthrobacter phage DrYang]